jgi:hypothetical protein
MNKNKWHEVQHVLAVGYMIKLSRPAHDKAYANGKIRSIYILSSLVK